MCVRGSDALRQMRWTLEMFPNEGIRLYGEIADVYEQKKMFAEAFAAHQQALSLVGDPNVAALVTLAGEAYKPGGHKGWMLKTAQILEQQRPPGSGE